MSNLDSPSPLAPKEARQLTLWTRRYLQTRNMGVFIFMLIMVPLYLTGFGMSLLLGYAIHSSNRPLVWVAGIGEGLWAAALVYFSIPRWGGRLIERLTGRYYRQEGTAELPMVETRHRPKWVPRVVGAAFGLCILLSVLLGPQGKYMQPISALYCVPFLVFLCWWQYPRINLVSLLWPILYAVHAILIVAGAPIVFAGRFESLNMFVPTFGYGLLAAFVGHLYNRLALRRLQRAARGKA